MSVPVPKPPPQHIVTSPSSASLSSRMWSSVVSRRAPEEPNGCPSAIAPPRTFTGLHVRFEFACPGSHDRGERLVDLGVVDVRDLHPVASEQLARGGDR